ncbi:RNA polymerase II-associated factor 1 homolog [Drosophila guanche]|uniref:RNA polymerase II-associated factor 1 homolog n=1 Tax=Drosophila guanche TaxID=7266 RepID=A0A3B0KFQ3_DROGU|nr:RNA polymerase II-associated factor 1 homolog [Drosophila guanche]SPP84566.1 blast:Zinc finger protein 254 [Drosophila guanche]
MPPTINNSVANSSADKRPQRQTERKSEIICRVKYGNNLPDIPFDLKFLQYPFDSNRFVQYNPTSLERNFKYDVLTEHDLGVTVDLINRELYQADSMTLLDPADEKLLEEETLAPTDSVRSRQHSRTVSWLRKSEYISTEQTRFQPQNLENIEAKVGYNVKKSLREETLYLDRDAQIKAIEKTFLDTKTDITKHYSKPNVVPVEVLPVFPDFTNWKYPCAQVIFDSDPAPVGKNVPSQLEEMSQAMIRGVMDESGEQFVAYFLPTEQTLEKRRADFIAGELYNEEAEYEYKIAREYNWNVKTKASKGYEENYFFVMRQDGIYYNELETRVRLNKRRVKVGQQPNNTKLVVHHRPLEAVEHRMQRYRERQLEVPGEEEEGEVQVDEEMDVDEEPTPAPAVEKEKAAEAAPGTPKPAVGSDSPAQVARDRQSRSRSKTRSRSASSSGSGSASGSGSRASSRSKSGTRSPSGSRSRTNSPAGSQKSGAGSARSRSRSHSRSRSKSGSRSRTPSKAGSRSRSPSKARSRSKSASRSRSGSRSGSGSRTPSRSRSGSPSGSGSSSGSGASDEE